MTTLEPSAAPTASLQRPQQSRSASWKTWLLGWLYLGLLVAAWFCLWFSADRHWLGTLLEFGPRWLLLLPIGPLALVAWLRDRRLGWLVALALLIGAGPFMGGCLPLPLRLRASLDPPFRVLTLNTDGRAKPSDVVALAESMKVDLVCLQECYRPDLWQEHFGPAWYVGYQDEFVVASRYPISSLQMLTGGHAAWDRLAVRCQLSTPLGAVQLVNLHTYSPRAGLEAVRHRHPDGISILRDNMQRRQDESQRIADWISDVEEPLIVAGDFNQSAGSLAYEHLWGRYLNAFSESGCGWGATFHSRWHGVRIDHILASREFQALECWPADDIGSAHRPVVAVLQLVR